MVGLYVRAFVNNTDSYIGSSPRNYHIYEEDGRFSFIPWNYNLSFSFNATAFAPAPDAVTSTQDVNWPICHYYIMYF
ncbi:CotH kinase family protein [Cellulosilyticum ruminicola]|uniref:CotH kinase family protein n=1 Tax=Cellulosilyticum ruminicola TaxID=425254 RepID=UPI0038BC527E